MTTTEDLLRSFLLGSHSVDRDNTGSSRRLQEIPNYTSPPLEDALRATPEPYRTDQVIDAARAAAAAGNCTANGNRCHIPFSPPRKLFEQSKIGVIFYCGALVDPRGYSPLASTLATRYGLPVILPVFDRDIAIFPNASTCDSGRIDLAHAEFESVSRWVLAGHSLGGVSAMLDAWTRLSRNNSDSSVGSVGGLAMIASYMQQLEGCGETDFSKTDFPMTSVTGSEDFILNQTRSALYTRLLSNRTLTVDILGGNHGQFGSYNYTERTPILGQVDGEATIPPQVQWDLTTASIYHVAARLDVPLPRRIQNFNEPDKLVCSSESSGAWGVASPSPLLWLCTMFWTLYFAVAKVVDSIQKRQL